MGSVEAGGVNRAVVALFREDITFYQINIDSSPLGIFNMTNSGKISSTDGKNSSEIDLNSSDDTIVTPLFPYEQALALAGRGCRLLPVNKKKQPLIKAWQRNASSDPQQIEKWKKQFPDAQIGMLTGRNGGFVVLDVDLPNGEDSLSSLEDNLGIHITSEVSQSTPSGGRHYFFRYPEGHTIQRKCPLELRYPNLDLLADNSMVVVAPSTVENGSYEWEASASILDNDPGDLPEELLQFFLENQRSEKLSDIQIQSKIPEGTRNASLTCFAGTLRRKGAAEETIFSALSSMNLKRCSPPLDESEVRSIAKHVSKYAPESQLTEVCTHETTWSPPEGPTATLEDVLIAATEFLPGSDLFLLRTLLATYIANILPGPPVSLMYIDGSSSGKTEIIESLSDLPLVLGADRLTASGLLTGVARKQLGLGNPAGLLDIAGDHAILIIPEFSTILSTGGNRSNQLFSSLRRACDGKLAVVPGSGGAIRTWIGKLGIIGGVTGGIDRYKSFMANLGPRFLLSRSISTPIRVPEMSSNNRTPDERQDLKIAFYNSVRGLMAGLTIPEYLPRIPDKEAYVIQTAGILTAAARSPVSRDNKDNPLDAYPSEQPHRVTEQLSAMFSASLTMGLSVEEALADVVRLSVNTISPPIRSDILLSLLKEDGQTAYRIAQKIVKSRTLITRELETLWLLRLVRKEIIDDPHTWYITDEARDLLKCLSPYLRWAMS